MEIRAGHQLVGRNGKSKKTHQ